MKPPMERFHVDLAQAGQAREELEARMKELNDQIIKLIERMTIDDTPVLAPILHLTKKRSQLEKLARALNRVAPLVDEYDKLYKRKLVLDLAKDDPGWLAATLGDFSSDLNALLTKGEADWRRTSDDEEEA